MGDLFRVMSVWCFLTIAIVTFTLTKFTKFFLVTIYTDVYTYTQDTLHSKFGTVLIWARMKQ